MNKNRLLLFVVFVFQLVTIQTANSNGSINDVTTKKNDLASVLLDSAKRLYREETVIIKNINTIRYKGVETELNPLEPELMSDVVVLLEWAIKNDRFNVEANYMLGEVYFNQRELTYSLNKNAVRASNKYLSVVIDKCVKEKINKSCESIDLAKLKEMHREIKEILPYANKESSTQE